MITFCLLVVFLSRMGEVLQYSHFQLLSFWQNQGGNTLKQHSEWWSKMRYTVVHEVLNKILLILCENLIPWLLHFVSNCGNIKSWTPNFFKKKLCIQYLVYKCQKNISENSKFTAMLLVQILPSYYSISLCLIKNLQYQQNTSDVMWLVM